MANDTIFKESATVGPKYIPIINSLRGLASLMVCIHHLLCQPLGFFDHSSIFYSVGNRGNLGVQIFFVITGVVIPIALINGHYTYSLFGKFILKRIIRIEPPYLISILLCVVYMLSKNYYKHSDGLLSAKSLLLHIGYLIPFVKGQSWINPVFWTLAVEFQFYILISLLFPLLTSGKILIRSLGYLIVFGLALYFVSVALAPSWLPVFMMGIIYINWSYGKVGKLEFGLVFLISVALSIFLHDVIITGVSVCTLAVIHFFSRYQSKTGNFLGDISYSLYLIHMIFPMGIVNKMVPHATNIYSKLLVVVIGVAISIISAYIFYIIVEKPSKKLASKIRLKG